MQHITQNKKAGIDSNTIVIIIFGVLFMGMFLYLSLADYLEERAAKKLCSNNFMIYQSSAWGEPAYCLEIEDNRITEKHEIKLIEGRWYFVE